MEYKYLEDTENCCLSDTNNNNSDQEWTEAFPWSVLIDDRRGEVVQPATNSVSTSSCCRLTLSDNQSPSTGRALSVDESSVLNRSVDGSNRSTSSRRSRERETGDGNTHVRRPKNKFMIFANERRRQIHAEEPQLNNAVISQRLGKVRTKDIIFIGLFRW